MKDDDKDGAGRVGASAPRPVGASEAQAGQGSGTDPEEVIATAEWLFWDYVRDLRAHREAIAASDWEALDPGRLKKATETAKTVRQAIHMLMEERQKLDRYRKDIAGGIGGGELDLDAARDEIGLRLACLRRAGTG
ncbi:permease [Paracoccus methylarcula]|uniref:Permease n=1 Tax=Paracoccus methylarcula TaxID=72022 RepID=A0A422QTI3_9RHOB|nr:permease [Paracoccus methylarcula]RNF33112.1 permease [Paracoccus methylarcula]